MPCKVLRVDVQEGAMVKKDQALVVIESMKMETMIRSPYDGIVKKVVHGEGVSGGHTTLCGAMLIVYE
jgi:3-methylcrotonyl-CoA carboxylase alpha subunit